MTDTEIQALTTDQLEQAIHDIGDHPFAERFQRELTERKLRGLQAAINDMENRDTLGWHGIEKLAGLRREYTELRQRVAA